MELVFPFKNIALNYFWEFLEDRFIHNFFWEFKQKNNTNYKEHLTNDIKTFYNSLPNFENEILQIVNTTNQETINYYFKELKNNIDRIKTINEEEIKSILNEYFKKNERKKYKHLEEYEAVDFMGSLLNPFPSGEIRKKRVVNYNFYCIEKIPELVDFKYFNNYYQLLSTLRDKIYSISDRYILLFQEGKFKVDIEKFFNKAVVYVEGEHDIKLIKKAAILLGQEKILEKIELRQRSGFKNLDKIWNFYKNNSVEIIAQKKILLYDCDTHKSDENFGNLLYKRTIPTIKGHIITKGIENLFSSYTIQEAIKHKKEFVDFKTIKGSNRGKEYYEEINEINKDEKANFCEWICSTDSADDFKNFEIIFKIISDILEGNV